MGIRSSSSRGTWLKVAGICGVAGPLVAICFIAISILRSPWFSWTGNALSDLGARAPSSCLFNSGLILGGVLIGVFAVGLRWSLRGKALGNVGALVLLLSAGALCAIGIFPETAGDIHLYVSYAFFVLLVLSLWIIGAALVQLGERRLGALVVVAGVVAAAVWALPWSAVAIPEIIASLAASACSIALSVRLLRTSKMS